MMPAEQAAILRLQARFFGAPVAVWEAAGASEYEEFLAPSGGLIGEQLPGEADQVELAHALVGSTYRARWRRMAWVDRLAARVAVLTAVPSHRCLLYRRGSAKWYLPPPSGTVITVRSGGDRSFRAVTLHAGVCHKPGSWIGCRARILWAVSQRTERRLPVNWQPLYDGTFVSHFATCPHAKHFRTMPSQAAASPR